MKYRKKPVVIDAIVFDGENFDAVEDFVAQRAAGKGGVLLSRNPLMRQITIPTLEGDHQASAGDYIIRGVKGEYYPCKPDIFALTYELAE